MVYFYSALHRYHGVGSWGLCHSLAIKGKNEIFDFHFCCCSQLSALEEGVATLASKAWRDA